MSPPANAAAARLLETWPRGCRAALALSGALATLSFAPFGAWPLGVVALIPLFLLAAVAPPREAAWLGFSFGLGLFLSGTYWVHISIHVFGQAPLALAIFLMLALVLIMAAWLAACGWLLARLVGGEPWRLLAAGPAAWVAVEWLRGWVLSGFPWLSLGYGQVDSPAGALLPVTGVYGVSLLVAFAAASLALALMRVRPGVTLPLALLPFAAGALLAPVEWTRPAGPPVATTLVQGGVSQDRKWLPEQFRPTLELYRNALLAAADSDIVVWPEVAIPALDTRVEPWIAILEQDLGPGQSLLYGILEQDGEAIYNSVVKLDAAGRQVYRKRHLVPFGEFFPVPDFVREWMRMLSLPHSDLSAGESVQPLITTAGGERIAVAICYEDAYGNEQLYAFPEASLIVNVSNDAWFGDSIAPHQHLEIARARAREVGRYAIRATNNGISAYIGPGGEILERAPQFEFATLSRDVVPMSGATPYVRTGNWPVVTLVFGVIALLTWQRRR